MPSRPPAACWTSVVQKKTAAPDLSSRIFADCKLSKGLSLSLALVDASAIIYGDKFAGCADMRGSDPVSRHTLAFLAFLVETLEPSSETVKKGFQYSERSSIAVVTGDLQTLSDVDLRVSL